MLRQSLAVPLNLWIGVFATWLLVPTLQATLLWGHHGVSNGAGPMPL